MHEIPSEDQYYGFFKAGHVARYLDDYCRQHVYRGTSLASRIRTEHAVHSVIKTRGVWEVETAGHPGRRKFRSRRLVDASGMTSIPNLPDIPGQQRFKGRILHHKDFAELETEATFSLPKKIIVLGGAKSAADVAYSCAKAGHRVTWIIRKSGAGPAAFVSAKGSVGYKNSNESFYTRLTSLFLVSHFSPFLGCKMISNTLNKTKIGRKALRVIWRSINQKAMRNADYNRADGQKNGFFNLKPNSELFWQQDSTGINQREDFFDVITTEVKVVQSDLDHLEEEGVVLLDDSRTAISAEILICATGWQLDHPYYDEDLASSLGLPTRTTGGGKSERPLWSDLDRAAELTILKRFPILASDWAQEQTSYATLAHNKQQPFRLWKSMVPVVDPSIIFMGKLMLGNHFRAAEVQALFTCAVLEGNIELASERDMRVDIAETVAWCRRRYLAKGASGVWFYWDMIPYTDMLLKKIGLSSHRSSFWLRDLFRPGFARDLSGLIDEYRDKFYTNVEDVKT